MFDEQPETFEAALHAVREVRVGIPSEWADRVTAFYCDVLRLPPWPVYAALPGGIGFGHPRRGLFCEFVHRPFVDDQRARFTIVVSSLENFVKHLDECGIPYETQHGLFLCDDCVWVQDPVGHRILVRQLQSL